MGAALVAAGVTIHLAGTIPAYRFRNADDSAAIRAVLALKERIVVADDQFTAQLLLPINDRKVVLLADTVAGGAETRNAAGWTASQRGAACRGTWSRQYDWCRCVLGRRRRRAE